MFKKNPIFFRKKIRWFGYMLAGIGVYAASYIAVNYASLSQRPGDYLQIDIIVALIGIVILIETGRRVLGIALSIIALIFLAYDMLGLICLNLLFIKGLL